MNTDTTVVTDETIKQVKDGEGDDSFLVLTYDLPSEKTTFSALDDDPQEEVEKALKKRRHKVQRAFDRKGVKLSSSVYIVRASKVMDLVSMTETQYEDMDDISSEVESDIQDSVKLDIVGSSYKHVIRDLLITTLDEGKQDLRKFLEIAEQKVKNLEFEDESDKESLRRDLYRRSKVIKNLRNRCDDLAVMDEEAADTYRSKLDTLEEKRSDLLDDKVMSRN